MSETLHPEEAVTNFYLIRHGHTSHTEQGKLYSDPASMLTDKGRKEARALAQWLSNEHVDALLSSPSARARATAGAIAAVHPLAEQKQQSEPVVVIEHLREWQVGDWEGRSYLEIKKAEPDVYQAWVKDPIRNAPPGGESIEALCRRVKESINDLCAAYAGKKVALVTHAEVIRAAAVYALGMPVDNFWRISIPTASVSQVDFSVSFATVQYLSLKPAGPVD